VSGYVDAIVQRWAISVDEYLRCPSRFALARYEDFLADPEQSTRRLLHDLQIGVDWTEQVARRIREAAAIRYQALSDAPSGTIGGVGASFGFGPRLLSRIARALRSRMELLGYGPLLIAAGPFESVEAHADIDVPALPNRDANCDT